MLNVVFSYWFVWIVVYFVVIFFNSDIVYRIFLSLNVLTTFVILLSIYNIKILVLVVSFLNGFECVVLRMITFVSENMSMMFVMNSSLFLVSRVSSDSTPILVGSLLTFCSLETSFLSVSLSSKSFSDSFSDEEDSFEVLDSSLLKSSSSSSMILSR